VAAGDPAALASQGAGGPRRELAGPGGPRRELAPSQPRAGSGAGGPSQDPPRARHRAWIRIKASQMAAYLCAGMPQTMIVTVSGRNPAPETVTQADDVLPDGA